MIIKTYEVFDMKDALIRAKYDLGPEAIIISKREIGIGKWYNPLKKKGLEVTFAVEEEKKPKAKPIISSDSVENNGKVTEQIGFMSANEGLSEKINLYCKLLEKDRASLTLEEKKGFVQLVMKDNPLNKKHTLAKYNVLVGPTGVGKTTSIAKLAANEYLTAKKKVGLITMDTYRIGAVEQLRTYASILDVNFEIANNPEEMAEKAEKLSHCDTILIDTLGTSPKDMSKLAEIRENLASIPGDINTYLVLSMTTDKETLMSILDRFKILNYNALIVTKIDEVSNMSNLWYLIENSTYPIQYFCCGQDVPDDIKLATLDNVFDYCKENMLYE